MYVALRHFRLALSLMLLGGLLRTAHIAAVDPLADPPAHGPQRLTPDNVEPFIRALPPPLRMEVTHQWGILQRAHHRLRPPDWDGLLTLVRELRPSPHAATYPSHLNVHHWRVRRRLGLPRGAPPDLLWKAVRSACAPHGLYAARCSTRSCCRLRRARWRSCGHTGTTRACSMTRGCCGAA